MIQKPGAEVADCRLERCARDQLLCSPLSRIPCWDLDIYVERCSLHPMLLLTVSTRMSSAALSSPLHAHALRLARLRFHLVLHLWLDTVGHFSDPDMIHPNTPLYPSLEVSSPWSGFLAVPCPRKHKNPHWLLSRWRVALSSTFKKAFAEIPVFGPDPPCCSDFVLSLDNTTDAPYRRLYKREPKLCFCSKFRFPVMEHFNFRGMLVNICREL